MNNSQNVSDSNYNSVFILALCMQLVDLVLFDDDDENSENDPEHQLLSLFSSEAFTNELVTIISEQAIDALIDYDNPRKRAIELDVDADSEHPQTIRRKSLWNWERARQAVFDDYMRVDPKPTFDDRQFERMFRITRSVFQQLRTLVGDQDDFFTTKTCVVTGKRTICPDVKILLALKVIAYGTSPHAFLDYFQMGETTARQCLIRFVSAVSNCDDLQQRFFRQMTRADAQNICELHKEQHGIDGMVGSLDCMHVSWKNCPVAWQGQYQGKEKYPTLVLEAMCDYNLYFWHHEFGMAGTLNDISIWDLSGLHKAFVDGTFTEQIDFPFTINGEQFDKLWVTVDGIYPPLARFVKTLSQPIDALQENYSLWQEKTRKDVERGFGVLQSKFHILCQKIEYWSVEDIVSMVNCCLMLHNWMVTIRVKKQETESSDWYDVHGNGIDIEDSSDGGDSSNGDGSDGYSSDGDGSETNNVVGGGTDIVGDSSEQQSGNDGTNSDPDPVVGDSSEQQSGNDGRSRMQRNSTEQPRNNNVAVAATNSDPDLK
jgi:hypothetical protein